MTTAKYKIIIRDQVHNLISKPRNNLESMSRFYEQTSDNSKISIKIIF